MDAYRLSLFGQALPKSKYRYVSYYMRRGLGYQEPALIFVQDPRV
jgi:hypothetical protein